jgi:hypothetical protein
LRVLPLGDMADLQVTPAQLTIDAPVNSTTSYSTVAITNAGAVAPDNIQAAVEPTDVQSLFAAGLIYPRAPGAFAPGNTVQIPVFFYPTAIGTFHGELALTASGTSSLGHAYQRTVRVPLTGNAGASVIRLLTRTPRPGDFVGAVIAPAPLPGPFPSPFPRPIPAPPTDPPRTSVTIDLGAVQPPVNNAASVFILNLGTLALEIPAMLAYWTTPVVMLSFPIVIDPGTWAEVKFDFGFYHAPLGPGSFSETLRILNNDPVTPEAQVTISGAVPGPAGAIRPEFVDFADVGLNATVTRQAVFENEGTVDLHVDKLRWSNGTDFRLGQPPALPYAVEAGASLPFDVEFGPVATAGFYGDYLMLGTKEGIVANLGVQARAG